MSEEIKALTDEMLERNTFLEHYVIDTSGRQKYIQVR